MCVYIYTQRIQFLKQDGTDLFTEGDIVGATGLYVTAMQLETELAIQALSCPNENEENAKVFEDNNNNNMAKNESSSQRFVQQACSREIS